MPETPNKVKYGLKNVHYAPLSFTEGAPTFGTPVPLPGAVSIKLSPSGEPEKFYADDGVYFVINNNMGYEGELELALIPQSFRVYALGEALDSNNVLIESSDVELKPFALLFEFKGDQKRIRHVLYNCTVSRPDMEGQTVGEKKEVQTETLSIEVAPLPSGVVKARSGDETSTETYEGWYASVYEPSDD